MLSCGGWKLKYRQSWNINKRYASTSRYEDFISHATSPDNFIVNCIFSLPKGKKIDIEQASLNRRSSSVHEWATGALSILQTLMQQCMSINVRRIAVVIRKAVEREIALPKYLAGVFVFLNCSFPVNRVLTNSDQSLWLNSWVQCPTNSRPNQCKASGRNKTGCHIDWGNFQK